MQLAAWLFLLSSALGETEIHFSPLGGCEAMVVHLIEGARSTVDAAVYSLNNPKIADALIHAKSRGVTIRLLLDRTQAAGKSNRVMLATLIKNGIDVRLHSKNKIEHNKFGVFDGTKVTTGSFNWTTAAEEKNSENCISLDETKVVTKYAERFNSVLWKENSVERSLASIRKLISN